MLLDDTDPCAPLLASVSLDLLALFETVTNEIFSDTTGTPLERRVAGIGRVMANIARQVVFDPPMLQLNRRGSAFWSRRAQRRLNVPVWKAAVLHREQFQTPTVRLRAQREASNAGLADWVRQHRYLQPVPVELGESGAALLLLWEVDHQQESPGVVVRVCQRPWWDLPGA